MKVTYIRVTAKGGPNEAMQIEGETEFEKEWLRVHDFTKLHDGSTILEEIKNANN